MYAHLHSIYCIVLSRDIALPASPLIFCSLGSIGKGVSEIYSAAKLIIQIADLNLLSEVMITWDTYLRKQLLKIELKRILH